MSFCLWIVQCVLVSKNKHLILVVRSSNIWLFNGSWCVIKNKVNPQKLWKLQIAYRPSKTLSCFSSECSDKQIEQILKTIQFGNNHKLNKIRKLSAILKVQKVWKSIKLVTPILNKMWILNIQHPDSFDHSEKVVKLLNQEI